MRKRQRPQRRPAPPKQGPPERGRPPLLTPELHAAIILNREILGMPEGMAGEAEGISYASVSTWKSRGHAAAENWENLTPKEQAAELPYLNFFKALRDARPKFIKTNLTIVQNAAVQGDWRAAARRLEWEDQAHFGRNVNLRGDAKHPIPLTMPKATVLILPDNRRGDGPKPAPKP